MPPSELVRSEKPIIITIITGIFITNDSPKDPLPSCVGLGLRRLQAERDLGFRRLQAERESGRWLYVTVVA